MIDNVKLIRSIGQFDSYTSSTTLALRKLVLVYAENGRGKTTLSAILRSLATGEALPITERKRLGATHAPKAVIACSGDTKPACFDNGSWSRSCTAVRVFDDFFIERNVHSGMSVEAQHRQNLHELILGDTGVLLARRVDELAAQIRQHNTNLKAKEAAIPPADRFGLAVDVFCGLSARPDVDEAIKEVERQLAAIKAANSIRTALEFASLMVPVIEETEIAALMQRTIADLNDQAVRAVDDHLHVLNNKPWPKNEAAEEWISTGMRAIEPTDENAQAADCPFCAQSLLASPIYSHYRAYFGRAYRDLLDAISVMKRDVQKLMSGDALATLERAVKASDETRRFWSAFISMPDVSIDTGALATSWIEARDAVLAALAAKHSDPLVAMKLTPETREKLRMLVVISLTVAETNNLLLAINSSIQTVKRNATGGNAAMLESQLARLKAIRARHEPTIVAACDDYLAEKAKKAQADGEKVKAQAALDTYRTAVFPTWQAALNGYLGRLGAAFQLVKVQPQSTSGRPACIYGLSINGHEVPVGANTAAVGSITFKTTLSAGDRNSLALAFFLSTLDQDPDCATRTLVFDDPMSSLDRHRRTMTIHMIRTLLPKVSQIVLLSHDERFLFDVFDDVTSKAKTIGMTPLSVVRDGQGSTLVDWDIKSAMLGRHDKRHAMLTAYLQQQAGDARQVAQNIRPHIERYLRTCCPDALKAGEMFGSFKTKALEAINQGSLIISETKLAEVGEIVDYANKFHHDTNPDADNEIPQDAELLVFVRRTLTFASIG